MYSYELHLALATAATVEPSEPQTILIEEEARSCDDT